MTIHSTIYPSVYYDDPTAAIEWLCRAFGFRKPLVVPGLDGGVLHSELSFGDGVVMVGGARREQGLVSPKALSGLHQALSVRVEDPDAHHQRALAAGARIVRPLRDEEYGSRGYMAKDPEGHTWYFGTYLPGAYWTDGGADAET